jgi:hypothetical protein
MAFFLFFCLSIALSDTHPPLKGVPPARRSKFSKENSFERGSSLPVAEPRRGTEREKERERERERKKETDTQTHRHTDTQTHRHIPKFACRPVGALDSVLKAEEADVRIWEEAEEDPVPTMVEAQEDVGGGAQEDVGGGTLAMGLCGLGSCVTSVRDSCLGLR